MSIEYKFKPKPELIEIGNKTIGVIPVEKKGAFTVPEINWLDSELKKIPTASDLYVDLALELAYKLKITVKEAQEKIDSSDIPSEFLDNYNKMMDLRRDASSTQRKINQLYALLILKRTQPKVTMSDLTDESTSTALVDLIAEFGINERNNWKETVQQQAEEEEDAVEKK